MSAGLALVLSYLIGSIPFGLIIGRMIGGVDVREHGSKRSGATNVLRTVGKKYGFLVFFLDLLKGVAAVMIARWMGTSEWIWALAAVVAVVGHIFPIFAGFKGGRGVSTAMGGVIAIVPLAFLASFVVWWGVVLTTRYVSLGSMLAALAAAVAAGVLVALEQQHLAAFFYCIVATVIIVVAHRDNISRLRAGTENKWGQSAKKAA